MALQYFPDFAWESMALIEAEQQRRLSAQRRLSVTPQMAQAAADMSFMYPQLSGGVISAAAVAGLDPQGGEMADLAGRSLEVDAQQIRVPELDYPNPEEGSDSFFKKAVRNVFMSFDLIYEDGIKGASRFVQGLLNGEGFDENVDKSFGFSTMAMHIAAGRAGVHSNVGTGFFPVSDIAPETEVRMAQGMDVWEAINNPEQLEMGIPASMLQQVRQGANITGIGGPATRPNEATANVMHNRAGQSFAVSPGRLIANTIMDPNERAFSAFGIFSGIGDVASNIFLDPSNALGGFVGDARAATRILRPNGVRQTVVSGAETWLDKVGIQGGGFLTRDVSDYTRTADDYLQSRHGQNVTGFLADNQDFLTTYEMLSSSKRGMTPNVGLATAITDATDPGDVANLIRDAVNKGELNHIIGRQSVIGRSIGSSGIVGAFSRDGSQLDVAGLRQSIRRRYNDSNLLGRLSAETGGKVISTMDPDGATFALGEWMKVARFGGDEISTAMQRMARIQPGQWEDAFNIVRDVNKALATRLESQGLPGPIAHQFSRVLDEVSDLRRYFIDETGRPVPFAGSKFSVYGDGTPNEIATAQTISEMISHSIPLIDIRKVRSGTRRARVAELFSPDIATGNYRFNLIGRHITDFDKLGPGATTKLMDGFMTNVWKPLVLLRPAWTARVIGDEQGRMGAGGLASLASPHPLHFLAIATGRTMDTNVLGEAFEHRLGMTPAEIIKNPKKIREWIEGVTDYESMEMSAAMTRRGGHIAGRAMRTRYSNDYVLQRKGFDSRYAQGWAISLRNMSSDPVASRVASRLADLDPEDVVDPDFIRSGQDLMHGTSRAIDGELGDIADELGEVPEDVLASMGSTVAGKRTYFSDEESLPNMANAPDFYTQPTEIDISRIVRGVRDRGAGRVENATPDEVVSRFFGELKADRIDVDDIEVYIRQDFKPLPREAEGSIDPFNVPDDMRVIAGRDNIEAALRELADDPRFQQLQGNDRFRFPVYVRRKDAVQPKTVKAQVYGQTLDLTRPYAAGKLDDDLADMLVDEGLYTRGANGGLVPVADATPHSTRFARIAEWMRTNGYGKAKVVEPGNAGKGYSIVGLNEFIAKKGESAEAVARRLGRTIRSEEGRFGLADIKQSFWDGEMSQYRRSLVTDGGPNAQLAQRIAADAYIDGIAARLAHLSGGKVEWQDMDSGRWFDMHHREVGAGRGGRQIKSDVPRRAVDDASQEWVGKSQAGGEIWAHGAVRYRNQSIGSSEVLEAIATGELGPNAIRLAGHYGDEITEAGSVARVAKELEDAGLIDKWGPETTAVARELDRGAADKFDGVVNTMFNMLMSRPSNYLSRSPAFRQFYWKRVSEMMPALDGPTQRAVLDNAAESLGRKSDEYRNIARQAKLGREGHITDAESLDEVAKAFALEETQGLLYDTARRRNFFDITRNIFPFGEAWLEIITTWTRLLQENPALIRRLQQGVEGARDVGLFYPDPDTGEEVYGFPGTPTMMAALFRDKNTEDGLRAAPVFQARASGLNLALNGFLPGVGPLVQMPAATFGKGIMTDPDFAWLQDFISPFGSPDVASPGEATQQIIPAWAKKAFIAVFGPGSGNDQRVFNNVVTDVLKTMETNGEIDMTTQEGWNDALAKAERRAKNIYAIRAFSQFLGPVGAEAKFEVEFDTEETMDTAAAAGASDEQLAALFNDMAGRPEAMTFVALGKAYQEIRDRNPGDDAAAYDEFTRRFGLDPFTFATGKSTQIVARSVTDPGLEFQARNDELFAEFPLTAYYVRPDGPDEEFSPNAYLNQINDGSREPLDPDEWVRRRNDLLGRMQYDKVRKQFGPMADDPRARAVLNTFRMQLMDEYPGYGYDNFGASTSADSDEVRAQFREWLTEPALMETGAGRGLKLYLAARDRIVQTAMMQFGITEAGFATANATASHRAHLGRFVAQMFEDESLADFAPIFQRYYQRELEGSTESPTPITIPGLED